MNKISIKNLNFKVALLLHLSCDRRTENENVSSMKLKHCFFKKKKKEITKEDLIKIELYEIISFLSSYQILLSVRLYVKSDLKIRSKIVEFSIENVKELSEFLLLNSDNVISVILYYDFDKAQDSINSILNSYKNGEVYGVMYKYDLQRKLVKESIVKLSEKYYEDNIPYVFEGLEFNICSSLVLYDLYCEGYLKKLGFVNINKSKFNYRLSIQSNSKNDFIYLEGNEVFYLGKLIAFKGKQLQLLQSLYKVKNKELTYLDISEKVYGDMTRNANTIYSLLTAVNNKTINAFNLEDDFIDFDSNKATLNKKYLNIEN